MKKLLILLVCGFAFTQSIQTKQVEVTITDWNNLPEIVLSGDIWKQIDISEYLNLDGFYIVKTLNFEVLDESPYEEILVHSCNTYDSMGSQSMSYGNQEYFYETFYNKKISSDCPFVNIYSYYDNPSIVLTFWVTGMFEDEGVGLQGDMNDDDIINIIDVVSLVNIIVGEG